MKECKRGKARKMWKKRKFNENDRTIISAEKLEHCVVEEIESEHGIKVHLLPMKIIKIKSHCNAE